MKANKNQLLPLKFLILPSCLILSTSLSSCNQNWTTITPIMCGSSNAAFNNDNDPFKLFRDNANLVDKDGQSLSYLPSNFAFIKSKENNFSFYGYSSPAKNWYDENNIKKSWSNYDTNSLGWYQSNDAIFEVSKEFNNRKIVNYYNLEISRSISFVDTIAQALIAMIDGAFFYQSSFFEKSKESETKMAIAWGIGQQQNFTFDHGKNDSNENRNFYELLFANSNFHVIGKSNTFFKTSAINFNFSKNYFPFATYENNKFTTSFKTLLEDDDFDTFNNLNFANAHWTSKKESQQETFIDNNNNEHKNVTKWEYQYENIPLIIQPLSLVKTYLDPTHSASFLVSDFYQNNTNAIKTAISDSWQKANGGYFVKSSTPFIPSYKSFNLKFNQSKPYKLSLNNKNMDRRLPSEIFGNTFICLFNYKIMEYLDEKNNIIEHDYEPSFNTIFPSYFLDVYQDRIYKSINQDTWILDHTFINDQLVKLGNLHNRVSNDGRQIDPQNVSDKTLLSLLGYLFADSNGKIETKNFVLPFEKF